MNESSNNNTAAQECSTPLKLRLSIPRNPRLEYVESVLNVLNESRFGYMHSDIYLGNHVSFSEAEVEVGMSESDVLFKPSWTAYSKFIPTSRCVSVGEVHGGLGTSISSFFATLASLRETGFSNTETAEKSHSVNPGSVFGTYISERFRSARLTTRPPPVDQ